MAAAAGDGGDDVDHQDLISTFHQTGWHQSSSHCLYILLSLPSSFIFPWFHHFLAPSVVSFSYPPLFHF